MRNNSFINILTIVLIVILGILFVIYTISHDELRHSVNELSEKIEKGVNVNSVNISNNAVQGHANYNSVSTKPGANAEFFDPKAEQGGRLVSSIGADTGNMNYLINNEATVSTFWGDAMDTLATRNNERLNEFEPLLAESWSVSRDNMRYRIKLREGILWHDFTDPATGKKHENVPVTADDFKFYIDVIKNEKVDALPLRGYLQDIEGIEVFNDREFDVIWKTPYFNALETTLSLMPLPRHFYHAYEGEFNPEKFNNDHERNRMIVGCGPYQFVKWEKGKRVIMTRFDNYYGAKIGIRPPVKDLVYELIQHPATRLNSLKAQDTDFDGLTPEQWINSTDTKEFDPEKGFLKKLKYQSLAYNYIGFNMKLDMFKDKRTRQALSMLVDRNRIQKDVYHDLARPVSGPFFIDGPANDKNVLPYEFSVEKAKTLLAEAGWRDTNGDGILDKDGKMLKFTVMFPNSGETYQKILPIIKEDMAKAGVVLELLGLEWSVLIEKINKRSFEGAMLGWTGGAVSPDPYQLWHSSGADQDSSSNFVAFSNPEADRLIEEIRTTFDTDKRNELYHKFHALIHDEAPYIFLFSPYNLVAVNSRYRNVRLFPLGLDRKLMWTPRSEQKKANVR